MRSAGRPTKTTAPRKALHGDEEMMQRYEFFLAARYLTTRRKQTFITIITTISVMGVAVGVAALIIGLSLATGIHQDIRERILGANAHITVFGTPGSDGIDDYAALQEKIGRVPGVASTAPVLFEKGLMTSELNPGGTAVFLKGVDPAAELAGYVSRLQSLTPEDIRRVARLYLEPEAMLTIAVGDQASLGPLLAPFKP